VSLDDVQVHLVETADDAAEAVRWLETVDKLAVDTETTGLQPHRDVVRLIQLGDNKTSWVMPVEGPRSWGGLALHLLDRFPGRIICHNLKYDQRMIRNHLKYELPEPHVHDTMLMSRVLDPLRSAALKQLSARLIDSRATAMDATLAEAMKQSGYGWHDVPLDFTYYWFYAGVDTVLTRRVFDHLEPQVNERCRRAYELELATSHVCGRMEDHGVRIDVPYATERYRGLLDYVEQLGSWCREHYGVNPGSNAQVVQVLTDAGHRFVKLTQSGATSLDKEVLADIDHPLAHAVLRRRQAQKIANTYLRHFSEDVDVDDRLHPNVNSCEARTGRMSMSEPNLQNLPRKSDDNRLSQLVRNCIIPADGHVLLMCDFDQVEFRIFSSLTRDPRLVEAFHDDVFTAMCREIFADPSIPKSDPRRQTTKNSIYARLYGAGNDKFAHTAGISLEEAKRFNALLDDRYPALRSLQQGLDREARQHLTSEGTAYLTSPLTGRRFAIDNDQTYKLVNYLVQGTAAEVLKLKLVELSHAGVGEFLVVPVHDEVILEVPVEDLHDVSRTVLEVMNDTQLFPIPVTASLSVGLRWGSKVDYRPDLCVKDLPC